MRKHKLLLLLTSLLLAASGAFGQKPLSSPYSRYGIGDLFRPSNGQSMAMGGAGIGQRSPFHVNTLNPASYTAFDSLSFVFEGGVTSNFQTLKTTELNQQANFSTVKSLLFGFPVNRWWKASIGLLPFSQVGYKIADEELADSIGLVRRYYEGSGGINQVYLGQAFRLSPCFSAGFNLSYLFGTMSRLRSLTFPDSAYVRYFRVKDDISVNDFMFTYGLQYHKQLSKNLQLTAGATFSNGRNISATKNMLSETYLEGSTGIIYVQDTIENEPGIKGDIFLPNAFGAGVSLEHPDKWLFLADLRFQDWEKFSTFGEKDSLKNSLDAAFGFQYIPNNNSLSSYFQKISYRVGARYSKTYLQLKSHQLDDMAFTLGLGLPLARTKSRIHLGMEFGRRGTTSNQLIRENYVIITLGFSIFENWFIRRKFE